MLAFRPSVVALAACGIAAPIAVLSAQDGVPTEAAAPAAVRPAPDLETVALLPVLPPPVAPSEMPGADGLPTPRPPDPDLSLTGVVPQGDGQLYVLPGRGERIGSGPLQRFTVAVEGGIGISPVDFGAAVERILTDGRSWGASGRRSFQRVSSGDVDIRVVLASPRTTDRLCFPLTTEGKVSCGIDGTAVINALRWQRGADAYEGELGRYREYVVNHEVGHVLGFGHADCPGPGQIAPVMMQQTITIGACVASPWPYPDGE